MAETHDDQEAHMANVDVAGRPLDDRNDHARPEPETEWRSVSVVGSRQLPPDPGVMEAIGLNHAFETAVADLVDNSIDAEARTVLIRFVRNGDRLLGLLVVDDGHGMDEEMLDRAMTVGGQRDYDDNALGHFGMGLKAASLGQAVNVTVISRTDRTPAAGRRWAMRKAAESFECDLVEPGFAAETMDSHWGPLTTAAQGTVVRWDDVKAFPGARNSAVVERYIETTLTNLRHHLGLVFHRLLEERRVDIVVDVYDLSEGSGPPFLVEPIDPFAYVRTGHNDYPRTLTADVDGEVVALRCHIWPGRSQLPGFLLPGGPPERHQGFFFYRRRRLLQIGGWNGAAHPEKHLQLARVAVDIDEHPRVFAMNAEKTRVETRAVFARAVEQATAPGSGSWEDYLRDAEQSYRESRKRIRTRPRVVPPGKGLSPAVRKAIGRELEYLAGEDPIEIRWGDIHDDSFFDIDRAARALWLNKRYRSAILGGRDGSLNDAPMVKALLYLLLEDLFRGEFLGAKDRDNLELWQAVLTVAAKEELT